MNFSRDPQQQENNHRQEGDENPSAFQTSKMSAKTVEMIIKKRRIKIKTLNLLILSGASLLHHHPITTLWSRFATVRRGEFPMVRESRRRGEGGEPPAGEGIEAGRGWTCGRERRPMLVVKTMASQEHEHIHPKQLPSRETDVVSQN